MEKNESLGYFLGFVGVLAFSLTLPATRVAVTVMPPAMVGLGRALVAAAAAALFLAVLRPRRPRGRQWASLAVVAAGVVFGFPFLSAWAMQQLPSSHGAIVLALLPLATALFGALRGGERPSMAFWLVSILGSLVVIAFALSRGAGSLQLADLALVAAVLSASLGYAEGARLTQSLGGWQVISWALVLSCPLLLPPVLLTFDQVPWSQLDWRIWLSFLYVALVSQYLAFFAWYLGMALGGVAKVGQLQLLQTFLTLGFSWLLLGEVIDLETLLFALAVFICVAWSKQLKVTRPTAPPHSQR
ncbi:MAG: DMT family transporter [Rhodospirillales bacterium]|nr:DMT family transporter [Rhodospirillales bacterium]